MIHVVLQTTSHRFSQLPIHSVTVFYYFGVKINAASKPMAQLELSTGDWIGPFNLVMAQKDSNDITTGNASLIDSYVARYVQSQSIVPPFLQNLAPAQCTLYTKPDLYAAFLGNPALKYTAKVQTNYTLTNDPYECYLETCHHGNLQPILPHLELDFVLPNDANNTLAQLKFQYKIIAAPTPDEQAYRVIPQLQSKFQGQGGYNIIGGPYCYGDDPRRAFSFDMNFTSTATTSTPSSGSFLQSDKITFVRGCIEGYPCVPPAAMGGIPTIIINQTCPQPPHPDPDHHSTGVFSNVLLGIICYSLTVALLVSITFHCQVSRGHNPKKQSSRRKDDDEELIAAMWASSDGRDEADAAADNDVNQPVYFGAMDLMKGVGITAGSDSHRNETSIGPFGDLDGEPGTHRDPLQEPLLGDGGAEKETEAS
jgi:hypothetical protein